MPVVPLYRRIGEEIRAAVENGQLAPGQRLPSELELAERFGVTRMTIRQALDPLERTGLLVRRRGAGTFVAAHVPLMRVDRLVSFTAAVRTAGLRLTTQVLEARSEPVHAEAVEPLGIAPGSTVVRVSRLLVVDDLPTVVISSCVPAARAPGLESAPLPGGSLYAALRERYGLEAARAVQRVSATTADGATAQWLELEPGDPVLKVQRTAYDARREPFEHARAWVRPGFELFADLEV
jgi:GntR family transcriptional regulator